MKVITQHVEHGEHTAFLIASPSFSNMMMERTSSTQTIVKVVGKLQPLLQAQIGRGLRMILLQGLAQFEASLIHCFDHS